MLESGKQFIEEFVKQISQDEKNMRMLSLQIHYLVFLVIVAGVLITIILLKREINKLKYKIHKNKYEKTTYYEQTKVPYNVIMNQNDKVSKGKQGEYRISLELSEFEKKGAKLLFNCYLPKENSQYGEFSEVDVMLIHSTGIYVIESKNYQGGIEGKIEDRDWYQSICKYVRKGKKEIRIRNKNPFYNPILQNKVHIDNLNKFLDENNIQKDIPIYSLIVFSDRGTLDGTTKKDGKKLREKVINTRDVYRRIVKMGKHSKGVLSQEDIKRFYDILYPHTKKTEDEIRRHRNAIQKIVEDMYPVRICPNCGAQLVMHSVLQMWRWKNYYGCMRFPQCRYKEKI